MTCQTEPVRTSTSRLLSLLALFPLLLASACGGSDEPVDEAALTERLGSAAATLADAERLDFTLAIDGKLPAGVQGLESAEGFGNRTPAFEGDITIAAAGTSLSAEVVAVDGQVWAKLGFSPEFFTIDPAEYGAPDPAALIGTPGGGVAALIEQIAIESSSSERDGKTVLTSITGTVDGALVSQIIPSAGDADFRVTVRLTEDDAVHDVTLTGAFYPDADDVTYVVTVTPSDAPAQIAAPGA